MPYNPDLLIVPECEKPTKYGNQFYHEAIWGGDNENMGLGIFSFNNIIIDMHSSYSKKYRYAIPVKVTNLKDMNELNLIAIWSKPDSKGRYVTQIWDSLNYYKDLLESNTIVVGDFNSSVFWDKKSKNPDHINFIDVVDLLGQYNIYSAYHTHSNIEFGSETEQPTLYFTKHKDKQYHIDYIFASDDVISRTNSVSIGTHDEWISYSDHMPLIINFE
ncbi:hypothetical protein Mpsy_0193 [Methanolobus psychrophilus R15]|nr:hypothetical protein Mpsy_0189 [Methanolobus psychrophilus R15]AFV22406.1 hypothetical protein Mpsy_0193 [Methanolobus psychrophilus R15]